MVYEELQRFKNNMKEPWGILHYTLIWSQLEDFVNLKNLEILDFGSGFGTTANYLAENNEVIAIEPNADMIKERERENNYTQINGKFENLKDFEDDSFDLITCHNVLEFADERADIVKEFLRILKPGGILSIVKHNKYGKIMFKAVFENNADEALNLLDDGDSSNTFGKINYYNTEDITKWGENLKPEKMLGVRILGILQQNNEPKYQPDWIDKMLMLEMRVCDLEQYKNIAYLHHILLRKI